MDSKPIGIGSTLYCFDENRRVYKLDEKGRSCGGPIYRDHWRPSLVVRETRVSWVLESGHKIAKRDAYKHTLEAVNNAVFVYEHGHRIAAAVDRCHSPAILRQIAQIIGYDAGE